MVFFLQTCRHSFACFTLPLPSGRYMGIFNKGRRSSRPRFLVGEAGLEPACPYEHWTLNPARLPIPPLARNPPGTFAGRVLIIATTSHHCTVEPPSHRPRPNPLSRAVQRADLSSLRGLNARKCLPLGPGSKRGCPKSGPDPKPHSARLNCHRARAKRKAPKPSITTTFSHMG